MFKQVLWLKLKQVFKLGLYYIQSFVYCINWNLLFFLFKQVTQYFQKHSKNFINFYISNQFNFNCHVIYRILAEISNFKTRRNY